jgi:hypothetical protein
MSSSRASHIATVIGYASNICKLVDSASDHMLVSKIKPCMSKFSLTRHVQILQASRHVQSLTRHVLWTLSRHTLCKLAVTSKS